MTILFIGDSFTTPDPLYTVWPSLISQRLGDYPIVNRAVSGSGYLRPGAVPGSTSRNRFSRQALYSPPRDVKLVVIFGSSNDRHVVANERDWYKTSVWSTHREILATYPDAELLVVTPQWSGPNPKPREIDEMQSHILEVMWGYNWKNGRIDPNPGTDAAAWWFPPTRPELWEADKFHPSQLGHNQIADKLEPIIRRLLGFAAV